LLEVSYPEELATLKKQELDLRHIWLIFIELIMLRDRIKESDVPLLKSWTVLPSRVTKLLPVFATRVRPERTIDPMKTGLSKEMVQDELAIFNENAVTFAGTLSGMNDWTLKAELCRIGTTAFPAISRANGTHDA